jgi:hypothetical protein
LTKKERKCGFVLTIGFTRLGKCPLDAPEVSGVTSHLGAPSCVNNYKRIDLLKINLYHDIFRFRQYYIAITVVVIDFQVQG